MAKGVHQPAGMIAAAMLLHVFPPIEQIPDQGFAASDLPVRLAVVGADDQMTGADQPIHFVAIIGSQFQQIFDDQCLSVEQELVVRVLSSQTLQGVD